MTALGHSLPRHPVPAAQPNVRYASNSDRILRPSEMTGRARGRLRQLFNNLISARKERRRHSEAERLSGLEVDDQLEFGPALHRQVGWLLTLEDAIDVASSLSERIDRVCPVRDETTIINPETKRVDCWQSLPRCQRDDQSGIIDR